MGARPPVLANPIPGTYTKIMRAGKEKPKKIRMVIAAGAVLLVAVILLAVLTAVPGLKGKAPAMPALETRVRSILELPTAEYIYKDILYLGDTRSFLFFKTMDRRLLFSVQIRVRAGINLDEGFRLYPDKGDPKRIYVRMPRAKIVLVDADDRSIRQYFEQGDRFGRLEFSAAIEEAKPRVERDARDRGLLNRAEENARGLVQSFLQFAGFEEVQFLPAETPGPELRG
jgi:hypothetical protein